MLRIIGSVFIYIITMMIILPFSLAKWIVSAAMWGVTWQYSWNWLAPTAFGVEQITYMQGIFAYLLVRILLVDVPKQDGMIMTALKKGINSTNCLEEKKKAMMEFMKDLSSRLMADVMSYFVYPWIILLIVYVAKNVFLRFAA
jgi:hypothetical protein